MKIVATISAEGIDFSSADFAGKSPSQRLRNALYISWAANDRGFAEFKPFYEYFMEILINNVKEKIE